MGDNAVVAVVGTRGWVLLGNHYLVVVSLLLRQPQV